jgi:hypothetical protein
MIECCNIDDDDDDDDVVVVVLVLVVLVVLVDLLILIFLYSYCGYVACLVVDLLNFMMSMQRTKRLNWMEFVSLDDPFMSMHPPQNHPKPLLSKKTTHTMTVTFQILPP